MLTENTDGGVKKHKGDEVTNGSAATRSTMLPNNSWNVAALLNPKGFNADSKQRPASPAQLPANGVKVHTNGQPQLQFQFSSTSDTSSGHSHPSPSWTALEPTDSVSTPTQNGMTSMIERMNNLQDRSFVPVAKRRKIQEEAGDQTRKHGFSSGGSGMLSDHVNQKQREKQSAPTALQSQSTLDLTGGTCSSSSPNFKSRTEAMLTLIDQAMMTTLSR